MVSVNPFFPANAIASHNRPRSTYKVVFIVSHPDYKNNRTLARCQYLGTPGSFTFVVSGATELGAEAADAGTALFGVWDRYK